MSADPVDDLKTSVATACRVLAARGLVDGVLGHVSARHGEGCLVRCRGPRERGLARTSVEDICYVDLAGHMGDEPTGWEPPKELPIHTGLYGARPEVRAVVHAHPRSALLCGLAGLVPQPVFGAFNMPALRMALGGIPVYPRSVLISRLELANEMMAAMGDRPVCLLRGHGITVTGPTVESATVAAVNLDVLLSVTIELAMLGAFPAPVDERDLAELPDLGGTFNDVLTWRSLVADLDEQ